MENVNYGNGEEQGIQVGEKPYPTVMQAIHLVVLYIFIQADRKSVV